MSSSLRSLIYAPGSLQILDQLKVPQSKEYVAVPNAEAAWSVVKKMQVRGAPLIAIVSALGLAVEASERKKKIAAGASAGDAEAEATWLKGKMDYLRTSRPTAVNLFNAMDELTALVLEKAKEKTATAASVLECYIDAAETMLEADLAANKALGENGADAVLAAMAKAGVTDRKARVLTICNTGSLACAGWGTALGIVRSLHARGQLERAYALETRPYNQGSRLTAFELVEDKLPGTLICDSMAAALMQRIGVDAVLVGADRVAANGDSANKIGTYALSILAKHHGVPFFVAAPTTTLDPRTPSGAQIPIEERPAEELCCINLAEGGSRRIAAEGIETWNPAFDVAPATLIAGIVTERGTIEKRAGQDFFDVPGHLREAAAAPPAKRQKSA
eukprot:CAMPEP_0206589434 /NCGR_PEP_ID=MMETSP0325_2-20121206/38922_1 /ASSEMBLY_ACC=CAM_ASM_000347 /TAXON_ID=2866 /ORGANISM="Crypthecodinium cohnii, Strain Seligo" /LENGTH=390 /DNA_ID=CAMNT_0054097995 /DNA_START=37 /DNA_END=1212 /DNA_ORIENTATION=-